MKKVLLGQNEYNEIVFAELEDDNKTIRGFNGYHLIFGDNTNSGDNVLDHCSWSHEVTIDGIVYKSGDIIDSIIDVIFPHFNDDVIRDIILNGEFYEASGFYCCECGMFHDSDQYYDISYVVADDEVFCKDCVDGDDLLIKVNDISDAFSSKDIQDVDISDNFEEIDTLFCDSSGFGNSGERALTINEAKKRIRELIVDYGDNLYSGLTGIGQFQVYLTFYKRG